MRWTYLCLVLITFINDSYSLRNVRLAVSPRIIEGKDITILCLFDIENAQLYSVKWYRGQHEFYRYMPKEIPTSKFFALPGVNVELSTSNAHQVTLLKVPQYISGNFSCEVTTEAPLFSSRFVTVFLKIRSLDSESEEMEEDDLSTTEKLDLIRNLVPKQSDATKVKSLSILPFMLMYIYMYFNNN